MEKSLSAFRQVTFLLFNRTGFFFVSPRLPHPKKGYFAQIGKTSSFTKLFFPVVFLFFIPPASYGNCEKPVDFTSYKSIDDYYEQAFGKEGMVLKKSLHEIIKDQTTYPYKCLWEILKEADEDENNPDNIITIYSRESIPKENQDSGSQDGKTWNREHVWPKSHGFPKEDQDAARDAHHITPSNPVINSARSNKEFDDGGQTHPLCHTCRFTSRTWEPTSSVKGNIARMVFYMDIRYEGDDGNTPDLELLDHIPTKGRQFGKLCTLLKWHYVDPVDDTERARNNIIFEWQGNRNPFIDHPEWVEKIWGKQCQL